MFHIHFPDIIEARNCHHFTNTTKLNISQKEEENNLRGMSTILYIKKHDEIGIVNDRAFERRFNRLDNFKFAWGNHILNTE